MRFVLRGFRQETGSRVFTFESMTDQPRSLFTVHADLTLAQRYRIPLQELPLLCRAVLERMHEGGDERSFSFTEEDMCMFADGVAARAEAAKQRKPPRRPAPTNSIGNAWRGPQR